MTETLTRAPAAEPCVEEFEGALTCAQVVDVTHDVRTFLLAPDCGQMPLIQPGQYLTFTVDVDGQILQRCYTISSAPTCPGPLAITVKRVPGGPVSNWLHDHLHPGDRAVAAGPYGRFSIARYPAPKYLFLSAGSGITPLMSMTRTLFAAEDGTDVVFVHSARSPDDIIFRAELATMTRRGGIAVTTICEGDSPSEHWPGPSGRLSLRTLLRVAPDLHDREVFTCGPPGYLASAREMLEQASVEPSRCHEENFDLTTRAANGASDAVADLVGTERYTVEFRRTGRRLECAATETVLHAAHRAGLTPPCMCTEGVCGTCKTTLVEGRVDMRHAGGIRKREIDQGQILICCSRPLGNLVVDA